MVVPGWMTITPESNLRSRSGRPSVSKSTHARYKSSGDISSGRPTQRESDVSYVCHACRVSCVVRTCPSGTIEEAVDVGQGHVAAGVLEGLGQEIAQLPGELAVEEGAGRLLRDGRRDTK
jgi:hypothetical protein